jgi:hypothetical protein
MKDGVDDRRIDDRQLVRFGERLLGSRMQKASARQNTSKLVRNLAREMITDGQEAEWRT